MHTQVLSILNNISLLSSTNLLSKFSNKLAFVLNTLDVNNFKDLADGLRIYFSLEWNIVNDTLINKVLAMLAVIYFYQADINRNNLLFELNKFRTQNIEDLEIEKFISIIEYFINNLADIVTTSSLETDTHRKKLILMERVNKFIEDSEIRDKTVDLMLLMNN